ncbi:35466_t:CDS:1, partial [Gigaspora margarita]
GCGSARLGISQLTNGTEPGYYGAKEINQLSYHKPLVELSQPFASLRP